MDDMYFRLIQLPNGDFDIVDDGNGEEYVFYNDSGLEINKEEPPPVPKCECGQEATWKHYHKRSCPPDKHSDWCKLYRK